MAMIPSVMLQRYCRYSCSLLPRRLVSSNSGSDGGNDDQDKKQKPKEVSPKQSKAQTKLTNLLSSLTKQAAGSEEKFTGPKIELSRPSKRSKPKDNTPPELRKQYEQVEPEMASAIKSVSENVGGGFETESQLLQSLRKIGEPSDVSSQSDIKNIISGLQVEKTTLRAKETPRGKKWVPSTNVDEKIDIFGAEPLGIFPTPALGKEDKSASVSLPTWDKLASHTLAQSISKPPANHFQELINWTNTGRVWSFPIDNEIGLDTEKAVGFHEHIFLERHLSGWCPKAGPIRHFMELVCVGLSKNPHITAERKKNVIIWYKEFFDSKRSLLEEVGAYPAQKEQTPKP